MLRDLDQKSTAADDDGDVSSNGPVGLETSLYSKRDRNPQKASDSHQPSTEDDKENDL